MPFLFQNLDPRTRDLMVEEIKRDVRNGTLYVSARLKPEAARRWADLLAKAAERHDEVWLAQDLRDHGSLETYERKPRPGQRPFSVRLPRDAPEVLAETEFNRLYARALCLRQLEEGGDLVEVYRGKSVRQPDLESEQMTGTRRSADTFLSALRESQSVEAALGLDHEGSGLSIRRVVGA